MAACAVAAAVLLMVAQVTEGSFQDMESLWDPNGASQILAD